MLEVIQQLQANMELGLEETNLILDPVHRFERCTKLVIRAIDELKALVNSNSFPSPEEEIHYFKAVCPSFYGNHFYFTKVYAIERLKRSARKKNLRKTFNHDLKEIELFFSQNKETCDYFYESLTYRDQELFRRDGSHEGVIEELSPVIDVNLTITSYKISLIIANEKYRVYLQDELKRLDSPGETIDFSAVTKDEVTLGISKSFLVEEIVALQLSGLIKVNGEPASLAWLTKKAEQFLNTDLKDFKSLDYANRGRKDITPLLNLMIKKSNDRANRLNK
jgi:hypothetical protein